MPKRTQDPAKARPAKKQTIWGLVLKSILLLIAPYAYLMLCGLVFDYWLKWYFMTEFIFYSMIALWIVAFVVVGVLIYRYVKSRRKGV